MSRNPNLRPRDEEGAALTSPVALRRRIGPEAAKRRGPPVGSRRGTTCTRRRWTRARSSSYRCRSKDFFEFVDSFQVARGQRVAKPKALQALSDLIARITSSPGFHDELPLGSRGKDWGGARPLLDRELGDSNAVRSRPTVEVEPVLPVDLADLKVKTKPEYVEPDLLGAHRPRDYAVRRTARDRPSS